MDKYDDLFGGQDDLDIADEVMGATPGASSLDQKVSLRERKLSDLSAKAPFRRINPPSVLAGSLGNQANLAIGPGGFIFPIGTRSGVRFGTYRMPTVQVANWAGDDAETIPVTVILAPVAQQRPTQTLPVWPFGIVQFGTRAISIQAEVDLATGTQFTVNASSVTLQVGLETGGDFVAPTVVAQENLAGMLSFYPTTHTPAVTRTRILYQDLVPGVPVTLTIPIFSRNLTFVHNVSANTAYLLSFLDSQGNTTYEFPIPANTYPLTPIPLATDTVSVKVSRTDAFPAEQSQERLIFGLAF